MENKKTDYSLYKCPYSHIEKVGGHQLHAPNFRSIWCSCGFRGPAFYFKPGGLNLEKGEG